jgi:hypothetical protein
MQLKDVYICVLQTSKYIHLRHKIVSRIAKWDQRFQYTQQKSSRAFQGDKMSLWKSRPKYDPTFFSSTECLNGKGSITNVGYFCNFK